jgi:hypothetical protein
MEDEQLCTTAAGLKWKSSTVEFDGSYFLVLSVIFRFNLPVQLTINVNSTHCNQRATHVTEGRHCWYPGPVEHGY